MLVLGLLSDTPLQVLVSVDPRLAPPERINIHGGDDDDIHTPLQVQVSVIPR